MVRKLNENVNVDLCSTFSCELVGRLQNLKRSRSKLYTAHMPVLSGKKSAMSTNHCARTYFWLVRACAPHLWFVHQRELTKNMFLHSDLLTSLTSSLTPLFFMIRKLAMRTNDIKDRDILTNHIVVYTRLTYVKPYQNIIEWFERIGSCDEFG